MLYYGKTPIGYIPPNKLSPNQKLLIGSVIALGVYSQGSPKVKKIMKGTAIIGTVGIGLVLSQLYSWK